MNISIELPKVTFVSKISQMIAKDRVQKSDNNGTAGLLGRCRTITSKKAS